MKIQNVDSLKWVVNSGLGIPAEDAQNWLAYFHKVDFHKTGVYLSSPKGHAFFVTGDPHNPQQLTQGLIKEILHLGDPSIKTFGQWAETVPKAAFEMLELIKGKFVLGALLPEPVDLLKGINSIAHSFGFDAFSLAFDDKSKEPPSILLRAKGQLYSAPLAIPLVLAQMMAVMLSANGLAHQVMEQTSVKGKLLCKVKADPSFFDGFVTKDNSIEMQPNEAVDAAHAAVDAAKPPKIPASLSGWAKAVRAILQDCMNAGTGPGPAVQAINEWCKVQGISAWSLAAETHSSSLKIYFKHGTVPSKAYQFPAVPAKLSEYALQVAMAAAASMVTKYGLHQVGSAAVSSAKAAKAYGAALLATATALGEKVHGTDADSVYRVFYISPSGPRMAGRWMNNQLSIRVEGALPDPFKAGLITLGFAFKKSAKHGSVHAAVDNQNTVRMFLGAMLAMLPPVADATMFPIEESAKVISDGVK